MAETGNFQLKQWEKTDRIQMEDFNADNAKVDAALAQQRDDLVALTAAAALYGNCKIVTGTYTGNGKYGSSNPRNLTFDTPPLALILRNYEGHTMIFVNGSEWAKFVTGSGESNIHTTWNGNSVSWYHATSAVSQFNENGKNYYLVALLAAA